MRKPLILIFAILIADQILKIWIKLNLNLGEEIALIGNWCKIHFIENEGMAFGMSFGGAWGKLFLTLFRIAASFAIFMYLKKLIEKKESKLIIYSMALIFAGAVGNIIDSLFYGLIFSESSFFHSAEIFRGGYGSFLHGKVVDMFYFPLIDTTFPNWLPLFGGQPFQFFNAIFNIADISITFGVLILIVSIMVSPKKDKEIDAVKTEENQQEAETEKFSDNITQQ
ncbi:MAG: lipoprotein signal peptidase [Bacteroidales bacterium]|nr:lipoprotein signal peptidase [Bacteroidales bacterium]MDD4684999.1 lipoprotein signal peptidase [Bacteroidales bacterium]